MFEKVSLDTWLKSEIIVGKKIERSLLGIDSSYGTLMDEESYDNIVIPTRSTTHSAGYDFRIPFALNVEPNVEYTVPLGIKCNLSDIKGISDPTKLFLSLYPRSSFGFKYGFRLNNTVGIIDYDYYNNEGNEGHILIDFICSSFLELKAGDKICQGIITPYYTFDDVVNNKRTGGIGSTGK